MDLISYVIAVENTVTHDRSWLVLGLMPANGYEEHRSLAESEFMAELRAFVTDALEWDLKETRGWIAEKTEENLDRVRAWQRKMSVDAWRKFYKNKEVA